MGGIRYGFACCCLKNGGGGSGLIIIVGCCVVGESLNNLENQSDVDKLLR